MSELNVQALDVSTTSVAAADSIDCTGLSNLFLELFTTVDAATLSAKITLGGALELPGSGVVLPALDFSASAVGPAKLNVWPGTIVLGTTTGDITFLNVAAGSSRLLLRIPAPPRIVQPQYTYTSGGGNVRIRLRAWGWKQT